MWIFTMVRITDREGYPCVLILVNPRADALALEAIRWHKSTCHNRLKLYIRKTQYLL